MLKGFYRHQTSWKRKKNYVTLLGELIETYFLQAAKLIQNKVWQHFDKTIESAEK